MSAGSGANALRDYYGFYNRRTDTLSMILCPPEQCCQHDKCAIGRPEECPASRNASCPLCGKCKQGLSETLGSIHCKVCSDTEWWLIIAFMLLLTAVYLYLRFTASSSANSAPPAVQVVMTKCLTYFYQVVPLLLPSHSVHSTLQALLTVFSLTLSDAGGKGVCVVPGLHAMQKLLLPLFAVAWLNVLAIGFVVAAWLKHFRSQDSGSSNINEQLPLTEVDGSPEQPNKSKPNDLLHVAQTSLWLVTLFEYSTVSQVALKLVACRTLGDERLSYYAPVYKCYSSYKGWEYAAFLLVAAVCLFPVAAVFVTKQNKSSMLAQAFNNKFYWYEGVLMSRRLILIAISFSLPVSNQLRQGLIGCGCILITVAHIQFQPFRDARVNLCETILLTLLSVIAVLSMVAGQEVSTVC